jgi:hypothetical protein
VFLDSFDMAQYISEITQFLNQLKQREPDLEKQQQIGRSLLWDKAPITLEEQRRAQASRVKQAAYVYLSKNSY